MTISGQKRHLLVNGCIRQAGRVPSKLEWQKNWRAVKNMFFSRFENRLFGGDRAPPPTRAVAPLLLVGTIPFIRLLNPQLLQSDLTVPENEKEIA